MRKQMNIGLFQLIILPSISLAACPVPSISNVSVAYGKVSWGGSYDPSCLTGFEVCWNEQWAGTLFCDMAPANITTLTATSVTPCARIDAQVTAVGEAVNDTATGDGYAGLPEITGLTAVTNIQDVLRLEWYSLVDYLCVSKVILWVCVNAAPEPSTCMIKEMDRNFTKLELYNYDLPICRYFYVFMWTTDDIISSSRAGLAVYIGSSNRLRGAKVTNVTSNSAVLEYQLGVVDHNCTTDRLQVCFSEDLYAGAMERCSTVTLRQDGTTGLFPLTNLRACTAYSVKLTFNVTESTSFLREVTFNTQNDGSPVLWLLTATADIGRVHVSWATASARTPCVRLFYVSWNSSLANGTTSTVPVTGDTRSYFFYTSFVEQNISIEVAAVFEGGGQESRFVRVYSKGLISSSSDTTLPSVLLVATVISLLNIIDVNRS